MMKFDWYQLDEVEIIKPETKETNSMDSFKAYFEKHRDMFFTIGIVLILDHFIFGGAFKEKLKGLVDAFLDSKAGKNGAK